jgi:hypothetical protein
MIFAAKPFHRNLVDNTKKRSLADPWVIAHAINENATVVTKEEKVTAAIYIIIRKAAREYLPGSLPFFSSFCYLSTDR